jgi:hypothetical protein
MTVPTIPSTKTDFQDLDLIVRSPVTCMPELNRKKRRAMGQDKLKLVKKAMIGSL